MTVAELPGNWSWGLGEASRPLTEGGYYLHYAHRTQWANQHAERFYEVRVDTSNRGEKHHVQLGLFEEASEIRELERLDHATITVDDPESVHAQARAEKRAHEIATKLAAKVNQGDYE